MLFLKRFILYVVLLLSAVFLLQGFRIAKLIIENAEGVRNTHAYEQDRPRAPFRVLWVGDSIAVGVGSKDPKLTMAGRLGEEFPKIHLTNLGMSGLRIHQLAEEFDPARLGRYDLIVAQIGANDIIRFTPLGQVEKDLDRLLLKMKKVSEQIVLLHSGNVGLAPFFPRPLEFLWRKRSLQLRALYQQYAEKYDAVYVNLFTERKNDEFLTDIPKYYSPDLLHPSGEGYGIWYAKMRATMKAKGVRIP